jgi:hypothetical protein
MIKMAYGEDSMSLTQVFEWLRGYKEGKRCGKRRQARSRTKELLAVFSDQDGVVHHEFAPQSHKVNKEYYLQVLRRLGHAIRR